MSMIDSASQRLETALQRLDGALDQLFEQAGDPGVLARERDALIEDRASLAEDLDAAMGREAELQDLADEASVALGAAIAEVRAALARED